MTSTSVKESYSLRRQVIGAFVVAILTDLVWLGWMGWDTRYDIDPVTQQQSGPYEAWQVIGSAISLLVVLVGALLLRVRPVVASVAMTVTFTASWVSAAVTRDDSGLHLVGALLLLLGLAAATTIVSVITLAIRSAARR